MSELSTAQDMAEPLVPVFDGHNDVLTQLRDNHGVEGASAFLTQTNFHIDRLKAEKGGFAGGFFAMWVDTPGQHDFQNMMQQSAYDVPLPEPVSQLLAMDVVSEQAAILADMQRLGAVTICRSSDQLRSAVGSDRIAAVLHLEGCEAIDEDFQTLDRLYEQGLRSLGPVWSRTNNFGHGVPFRFPSTPDIGFGLTELGKRLIRRCNEKGILVDLSHLNEAGFDDVAKLSNAPLVATHSNVHQLCSHARNLTDRQLEIIRASSGMVGLNFATAFLRNDGRMIEDTPVELMLRHLDYLIDKLGEEGVGLGSDFDGATVPAALKNSAGLPVLVEAMRRSQYGEALIRKICSENWVEMLCRTWNQAVGASQQKS